MTLLALDRYLAALPAGFESYPEALGKASVVTPWRDGAVGASLRARSDLPSPLRALLERPIAVSDWIPEVLFNGLMAAAADAHFLHNGGVGALQNYVRVTNRAVFKGPLYNVLFAVVSPSRLVGGVAQRWSAFHRGSTLEALERGTTSAVLELRYPVGLFCEDALGAHGTSFALAAELAGGREVSLSNENVGAGVTRYAVAWR